MVVIWKMGCLMSQSFLFFQYLLKQCHSIFLFSGYINRSIISCYLCLILLLFCSITSTFQEYPLVDFVFRNLSQIFSQKGSERSICGFTPACFTPVSLKAMGLFTEESLVLQVHTCVTITWVKKRHFVVCKGDNVELDSVNQMTQYPFCFNLF